MVKVLLFIEDGFEDMEAMYPFYRLQEAGYDVDVVGPVKNNAYHGKYGYPLTAGLEPGEIDIAAYAGIIIPGGQAPDRMRTNEQMVELVKEADRRGLIIGAICHGPQLLIEADIVRQRNVTCYKSILTDVLNAGAIYHDMDVIMDDNLVTSRQPADLPAFCHTFIDFVTARAH
jgi:protease I